MPAHDLPPRSWHALPVEDVAQHTGSHPADGLTAAAAAEALQRYGPNRISTEAGASALTRFLRQFHQPLVYLLLLAAGVTLALQEWIDATVILTVVIANAVIGFLQESRAEQAIAALGNLVPDEATVIRDRQPRRLPVVDIVPGDLISLEAGDKVPADLRLVHARSLRVDEAMLTGESVPVGKHTNPLPVETPLAERKNSAFAGSLITAGIARGLVVATANQTETGRIAGLIAGADNLVTPLTRQIERFSRLLMVVIVVVAIIAFWIGVHQGNSVFDMFMAAVALAVGAIPEGLPAAITITLAVGVGRMAKRRAIIRKLPAVETLGSTTVICSDKTGTLTRNEMTVQAVIAGGQVHAVSGVGYTADGHIEETDTPNAALHATLLCGLLCNDARLVRQDATHAIEGDPTEAALLVAAAKGGLAGPEIAARHPRIDVVPFSSEQQFMASLNEATPGGERIAWIKGSMERLLPRCTSRLGPEGAPQPLEAPALHAEGDRQATRGLRVLLFARKRFPATQAQLGPADLDADLEFLGLQAMMDPPRTEAVTSVRNCHRAGIRVKMITGDNLITARAIAAEIGLGGPGVTADALPALTGKQLAALSPEALADAAEQTSVFARVEPEQKLRLVQALQSRNHVVAMTGDGVNDAPALRQANIGVAMGITGTDVAKGAADMLLTDDNFASIEAAVEEGRGIFDNLTKFIVWTLPTNAGEAMILLLAIAMGSALPALPLHLLWINMTTAVLLGLMLVFEPKESGLMNRPPRDPRAPLINRALILRTGLVAVCMTAGAYALFYWELSHRGSSLAEARTAVVNAIVAVEIVYLFNCRSLHHSVRSLGWFTNAPLLAGVAAMILLQLAFTYLPLFNRLFETAPLDGGTWLMIGGIALAIFVIVGAEKGLRHRHNPSHPVAP